MITKIEKENWFEYDVIIATPEMMPMLGKIGKLLGPKGLMPNPKTGTVTTDVVKAIEETKKGKVNYRTDSFGNVHGIFGKVSFDDTKLVENLKAFIEVILKAKPTTAKGNYVKNISICCLKIATFPRYRSISEAVGISHIVQSVLVTRPKPSISDSSATARSTRLRSE